MVEIKNVFLKWIWKMKPMYEPDAAQLHYRVRHSWCTQNTVKEIGTYLWVDST